MHEQIHMHIYLFKIKIVAYSIHSSVYNTLTDEVFHHFFCEFATGKISLHHCSLRLSLSEAEEQQQYDFGSNILLMK